MSTRTPVEEADPSIPAQERTSPARGRSPSREGAPRIALPAGLAVESGCLHERFAAQARRTPDAIAVSCGDERLSYAELDAASNRLARRLRREGVGPEVRVGVLLERSVATITALLAVVKAGGAYLPLDAAHPPERMAYTLGDAGARVLITEQRLVERVDARAAGARTVLLDAEAEGIAAEDPSAPHSGAVPENLAYVLYTSGSTGRPKGVTITHANATGLFSATAEEFALGPDDVWTLFHSFAFDFSVWETWGPLLNGSRAVIVPYLTSRSPEAFLELLRRERVTVLSQTPSAFLPLAAAAMAAPSHAEPLALRLVVFDGEPLRPGALRGWVERHGDARPRLVNMYGITETTVHSTWRDITARDVEAGEASPIGVPLPGLSAYLLGPGLEPVPQGVPGEIFVGGYGVGRGYLDRPALTAERFVPDPYAGVPGARMYRSGDIARGTADGGMDYLRRGDHQVKVRGFRIELGEVENTIARHPGVRANVVVVREGDDGESALVAYVVPSPAAGEREGVARERVEEWARIYEKLYRQEGGGRDPEFDITGWNSSYSGEPIGAEQMREQVEGTVERIRGLGGARVLEIGCGTGLLLLRLAEGCEHYVGTDFSPAVLEGLGRAVARRGWDQVELRNRRADDFAGIEPGSFDVVVLNSVVQYFPDAGYLLRVLEGAARAVRPGGHVWVGDVRNLRTMPMLHAGVELARGAAGTPAGELRARLRRRAAEEGELLLDPELFHALPGRLGGVSAAAVLARPGRHHNEITRHRYDAVLQVGGHAPSPVFSERAWAETGGLDGVREALAAAPGAPLLVRGVPSAPLAGERRFLEAVAEAAETDPVEAPAGAGGDGVEPEALRELAREAGMEARVHWSRETAGAYDVAFTPPGASLAAPLPGPPAGDAPWSAWANVPLARSAEERLADGLREHLRRTLPEHMVPSAFVRLDELPLTPSGKVDLRALPDPGTRRGSAAYVAPRNRIEEQVAGIWRDVLRLDRVGVNDNFFNLGGHSLRAGRVVSQVRHRMGIEAQLGDIFDRPVLADFARGLEASARSELLPIEPVDRGGPLPLSFSQQRLWFLEQLGELGSTYYVPERLRLRGELDRAALVRALDRIVARHEPLRTTFVMVGAEPEQRIVPAGESRFHLLEHDLRAHPEAETELRRLVEEESEAPFDLEHGPLARGRLVQLAPDDHVLLLTLHNVAADGWSMGLLSEELGTLYRAYRDGGEDPLPPLAVQYADYAAWQRRSAQGEALQSQGAYWTRTLSGAPALLELPTDHVRPARQDHAGSLVPLELDEALTSALKAVGQRSGATLFHTLLAGWATVLGRLAGQEDVVIGTPTANRGRAEIEGLIGFFVNTLALRVDLSGSPTVAELLARVKARTLDAQQNQDLPFEQVVELVQPARSLAHNPLFQVLFTWLNLNWSTPELPGLAVGGVDAPEHRTEKFDLSLLLREREGRVVGHLTYATALFERATVERFVGYLRCVLQAMAADAGAKVQHLAMLPAAERARVVEAWNATEAAYPRDLCIHELVEAQVRRTPDAVAVVHEGEQLTYAELNARANRLARFLAGRGVGPDVPVGLSVERGPELIVALLAVLKAGGAAVSLDPSYPPERLRYMLADCAPAALLTRDGLAARFADSGVPVVRLDADASAWAGLPDSDPGRGRLTPDNAVYVTYTSGSTGRPKGVAAVHRRVVNVVHWYARECAAGEGDGMLVATSYSVDATYRNTFATLFTGGRLHLASEPFDPAGIVALIARGGVTMTSLTPTALHSLMEVATAGELAGMRLVAMIGEPPQVRRLEELPEPRPALLNLYGPTECSGITAFHRLSPELTGYGDHPVPVGRPVPNSRIYVLSPYGEPVAVGAAGEIHIGGVPVGPGYLRRPGLTAERYVPDPFAPEPGGRMYRTGDLGRRLADGTLEVVGRTDFQVKIRGFRIELGEIEAVLAEHPAVHEAVVVARGDALPRPRDGGGDAPGQRRLVAYYVAAGDGADAEGLRAHLAERLPGYMVPSAYVRLERFPVNSTGKLDRKALPAPDAGAFARRAWEAPVGATEEALAGIWAELLGVQRVSALDTFFGLGGHSLLATRMAFRISSALGVRVPLAVLFEPWSLRRLARWVNERQAAAGEAAARGEAGDGDGAPPLVRAPRDGVLPLTLLQEYYWMLQQLAPGLTGANTPYVVRLRGALDVPALERALAEVVRRHEALRTTFAAPGGVPRQVVSGPGPVRIPVVHLAGLPSAVRHAEARRLVRAEAARPFDLGRGPLLRATVLRLDAREWVLLVTVHHIVSDGWSLGVMVPELGALYAAFGRGEALALPEPEVQYADYAVWQRGWIKGEVLARHAAYWREKLAGARPLDLAGEGPGPARSSPRRVLSFRTSAAPLEALRRLGAGEGATLFMVLLAAFKALLARYSGQTDITVETSLAGRSQPELARTVGFFSPMTLLRTDLSADPTFLEAVRRVRETALGAAAHQEVPLFERLGPGVVQETAAYQPLRRMGFSFRTPPPLVLGDLEVEEAEGEAELPPGNAETLGLTEGEGELRGSFAYRVNLFSEDAADQAVRHLLEVLDQVAADPGLRISQLVLSAPRSEPALAG
jgi:amino acid adenylation domain-containing protein